MPSSLSELINDHWYGAYGLSRKRARYRCEKRGEDFNKYERKIKDAQKKVNGPKVLELMKSVIKGPSIFDYLVKDDTWQGAFIPVPMMKLFWAKRKRSSFRENK